MEVLDNPDDIDDFIKRNYTVIPDMCLENVWGIEIDGEANTYRLSVMWLSDRILFEISPYAMAPRNASCAARMHEYLLYASHEMLWGNFSINETGVPVLRITLPPGHISDENLRRAIDHLIYNADLNYFNVINLANDERAQIITDDDD